MTAATEFELAPPRFETLKPIQFAGIVARYGCDSTAGIPGQWERFLPNLGKVPGQVGNAAYGVCYNFDKEDNFDYLTGVEVSGSPELPREFNTLQVPSQKYVVFRHGGHISEIHSVLTAIWSKGIPNCGHKAAQAAMLERYGEEFNPKTGLGGFEIWVPIES